MMLLVHRYGQLGNRLAYLRVCLCFALEQRARILDLSFDEYAQYFRLRNEAFLRIGGAAGRLSRLALSKLVQWGLVVGEGALLSVVRCDAGGELRLIDPAVAAACLRGNAIIYDGWPVIDWNIVRKHDAAVREFFSLEERVARRVATQALQCRQGCDLLVGIHIRQGDYRHWQGGRHYFDSARYVSMMAQIREWHRPAAVRFLIASDTEQQWQLFSGFEFVKAPGHPVEDMYLLASCDEIYGPQSSFSGWASFYGEVPISWVADPERFEPALRAHE